MSATSAYDVVIGRLDGGWRVSIREVAGPTVSQRACRDAAEARTYASTVRQHLHWLSAARFREYYGIPEPERE